MPLPDLATYTPHRTVTNAAFDGVPVPGLRAEFFHRTEGLRVASVCRYSLGGRDLLLTWGWADEQHGRWWAARDPSGFWHPAVAGRPVVRLLPGGLAVRSPAGTWLSARGPAPASAR